MALILNAPHHFPIPTTIPQPPAPVSPPPPTFSHCPPFPLFSCLFAGSLTQTHCAPRTLLGLDIWTQISAPRNTPPSGQPGGQAMEAEGRQGTGAP